MPLHRVPPLKERLLSRRPYLGYVSRPQHVRLTFTTRVEQSLHHGQLTLGVATITYPRFIPIGGKAMSLNNPLPSSPTCSGSDHVMSAFERQNHTSEGYVIIPSPWSKLCCRLPAGRFNEDCFQRRSTKIRPAQQARQSLQAPDGSDHARHETCFNFMTQLGAR